MAAQVIFAQKENHIDMTKYNQRSSLDQSKQNENHSKKRICQIMAKDLSMHQTHLVIVHVRSGDVT